MTAASSAAPDAAPSGRSRPTAHRPLRWWREVLIAVGFYPLYSLVRSLFGSGGVGDLDIAFNHAKAVIHVERAVGLFFEPRLQRWYLSLPHQGFVRWWNVYYGTAHFVVTIAVLIFAFRRTPERYAFARTAFAAMTTLALIGFATFSLMPPRLLDDNTRFGACNGREEGCHGYGMHDTIAEHGGLWQFGSGAGSTVSNQYAAMPSMHFGWSSWCALTLAAGMRRRRWKLAVFLYPAITLFCILVTANHYWIDALAGVVALGAGLAISAGVERLKATFGGRNGPSMAGAEAEPAADSVSVADR